MTTSRPHEPFVALSLGAFLTLICLALSIPLIYVVNFQVINLSLFWLVCLVALPFALPPRAFGQHLIQLTLGLILIQLISLFWSPSPLLGINDTLKLIAFLVMLGLGLRLGARNWDGLIKVLRLYCLMALVQSLLVIALRVDSQFGYHLTHVFFRGDWSGLFFEKNILLVFFGHGADPEHDINDMGINTVGGIYNVYNDLKAGGFELNGNIAGAWGGLLTFLSLGVFDRDRPWRSGLTAFIHALSIVCCGSKGSLFLLGLLPILLFIIRFGPWIEGRLSFWQLMTGAGLLVLGGLWLIFRDPIMHLIGSQNDYVRQSEESAGTRQAIWDLALNEFKHHPLLGHGFGGWSKAYDRMPIPDEQMAYFRLPPHNSLILLWTQSGMAALLIGLGFLVLSLKAFIQLLNGPRGGFALGALGAFLFFFLQSLFENINMFTNLHQTAPLALIIGMCAAQGSAQKLEQSLGNSRSDSVYSGI